MKPFEEQLNAVIVDTYRSILKVEETILKRSDKIDLTINEMHLIESVGKGKNKQRTISEIAEDLGITLPSVTVGINKLMKKGYVENPKRRGCPYRLCFFDPYGKEDRLGSSVLS